MQIRRMFDTADLFYIDESIVDENMSELTPKQDTSPQTKGGKKRGRRETERRNRLHQLAEMGKLAAGLAHELKNPLSTLKLNLQLLQEDMATLPGAEASRNRLVTLRKEADRLAQTLDDFLRFAGRIELRPTETRLNEVVQDLVDFILPQAAAVKVRVHTSLTPSEPMCVLDVNLFKQAVLNLLINAIQAMARNDKDADVSAGDLIIRTHVAKDKAILDVSDTGIGIPQEQLPHIFEAYYTTKKGGTGLGLPTTRRIIEEHHGHISVTSEPGQGTNFRVELPRGSE